MLTFLKKRWFLLALLVLIPSGLTIGAQADPDQVTKYAGLVPPQLITGFVLFLMSFSLDSRKLRSSLRTPGPVGWASLVNFGFIPLFAWGLMTLQLSSDFQYGLMIAACVPCTMAAASVWTRRAGGNDAVSLLVTVLTNGLCFAITPLLLNITTSESGVELDFLRMFWRLVFAVLVPTLLGQAVRQLPGPGRFATRYKTMIGVVAQSSILIIVFSAACNAGIRLSDVEGRPGTSAVVLVLISCIVIHLVAMLVGYWGSGRLGFQRDDRIAVAFASSQKTLPIGVFIATDPTMFGNPDLLGSGIGIPFAVFPMLMYHASQLFIDTAVADRFAEANRKTLEDAEMSENRVE
jgi:solute carrier family 10 (sodium/bile acid cotransporter), member 7